MAQKYINMEQTIELNKLKNEMDRLKAHKEKFDKSIDSLEITIADLKTTVALFNVKLEDVPTRLRALEDKSVVNELIKTFGWFILGGLITIFIHKTFLATPERKIYSIENHENDK